MSFDALEQTIEDFGDLELALLLSFIAHEHCLIQTEKAALDALGQELQLVWLNYRSLFGLSLNLQIDLFRHFQPNSCFDTMQCRDDLGRICQWTTRRNTRRR